MTKKTVKVEYILATVLLAAREAVEMDLMGTVWTNLTRAVSRGDTIDIPLLRGTDGRIPGAVETLKDWLGRGIIEYEIDESVGIYFTVANRHFLEQVVKEQK